MIEARRMRYVEVAEKELRWHNSHCLTISFLCSASWVWCGTLPCTPRWHWTYPYYKHSVLFTKEILCFFLFFLSFSACTVVLQIVTSHIIRWCHPMCHGVAAQKLEPLACKANDCKAYSFQLCMHSADCWQHMYTPLLMHTIHVCHALACHSSMFNFPGNKSSAFLGLTSLLHPFQSKLAPYSFSIHYWKVLLETRLYSQSFPL